MAKQTINIGTIANDGTGSTLRAAGDLINDNFNEIYTAFGDGSTLSAGFVTLTGTETLTNKTLTSPIINSATIDGSLGGTLSSNGNLIRLGDSSTSSENRLQFGASNDLQIYHDGGNSWIKDSGTGNLNIQGSSDVTIGNPNNELYFVGTSNGAVDLYYDNSKKFETTSAGVSVTGDISVSGNATITGDLTVNGATTTVSSTNTTVTDNLLELNSGATSNSNDTGIIMERGSTGDNAIIAWDESADKFILGTTTATASDTGNLTITAGTIVANLEGNVTGNADTATSATTATTLATGRTIGMTGDVVWTSASFDGSGNVTGTASIQANTITSSELSGAVRLDILNSSGTIVKTLFGSGS